MNEEKNWTALSVIVASLALFLSFYTTLSQRIDRKEDLHNLEVIRAWEVATSDNFDGAILRNSLEFLTHDQAESLSGIKIINKYLNFVNLNGAVLENADFSGTDLSNADLSFANLKGATLRGARLFNANLQGANLWAADLEKANLNSANLSKVDLRFSNLNGAYIRNTNVNEANFSFVRLKGAFLHSTDLSKITSSLLEFQDQIVMAKGDNTTTLPSGVMRPESWPKEKVTFTPKWVIEGENRRKDNVQTKNRE